MRQFKKMELDEFKKLVEDDFDRTDNRQTEDYFGSVDVFYQTVSWFGEKGNRILNDLHDYTFDFENLDDGIQYNSHHYFKDIMGWQRLDNGLCFIGMYAGGDWEWPVYFIVYYDGEAFRAYVPTKGNTLNTLNNSALGNDDHLDEQFITTIGGQRHVVVDGSEFFDNKKNDFINPVEVISDPEKIVEDIENNFKLHSPVDTSLTVESNVENPYIETLRELVSWSEELREETKSAVGFWDDYAPDPGADHPSNQLFDNWRHENDFDGVLRDAKRLLKNDSSN